LIYRVKKTIEISDDILLRTKTAANERGTTFRYFTFTKQIPNAPLTGGVYPFRRVFAVVGFPNAEPAGTRNEGRFVFEKSGFQICVVAVPYACHMPFGVHGRFSLPVARAVFKGVFGQGRRVRGV
jgi:hypothetical protein